MKCATFAAFALIALVEGQSRNLPIWYRALYKYSSTSEGVSLVVDGINGDRGDSVGQGGVPFLYHTWQLSIQWPGQTEMTLQSVIFHENGSTAEYSYWQEGAGPLPPVGRSVILPTSASGNSAQYSGCAASLAPVGDALDGVSFDWMGEVPDLLFLGNETLSTAYQDNVTVAHWSSLSTCRDVYLVKIPSPPDLSAVPSDDVPVLFTVTDVPTTGSPGDPGWTCIARVRRYEYQQFLPVSYYEAGQSSPLWSLPDVCLNGTAVGPISASVALAEGYVRTIWLGVGCALSGVLGAVGSLLWSYQWMRKRYFPGNTGNGSVNSGGYRVLDII